MSDTNNENIIFFLEEKDDLKNNEKEIEKMMEEFTNSQCEFEGKEDNIDDEYKELMTWLYNDTDETNMVYFLNKANYGNDELFYEEEYTVKDLLKICSYYGLDKDIRMSKCKKQDIISTLIYFENLPENAETVQKRNRMWAYITELLQDSKMKKYIIWN